VWTSFVEVTNLAGMGKKAKSRERARQRAEHAAPLGSNATEYSPMALSELPQEPVDPVQLARRLDSVAIHLLRRLDREEHVAGASAARLSALSVLVFGGARTLGTLAEAESVTPPSMTRLVTAMETDGLVARSRSPTDGRLVLVGATAKGERLLEEGRKQRLAALGGWLGELTPGRLDTIDDAVDLLDEVLRVRRSG
jgi:DNA-binding MarR family transcriptional regulator